MVEFRYETLEALSIMGACFVVDVRFESLEALRFKGARFVIDFRCESLEATIFMGVSCLIDLFLRQVFTAIIYYCFPTLYSHDHSTIVSLYSSFFLA